MSLAYDVKRMFRKSKFVGPSDKPSMGRSIEPCDSKARHILGLDSTFSTPVRRNSASSTSTTKLRSVTFSDATTATGSAALSSDTSKSVFFQPELNRKPSAVLVKRQRKRDEEKSNLGSQPSNSSLRSFYDRNRTPLLVSQQTSDSSSRDFALRRGAPSIISSSSQEMEHSKQLRFFSRLHKKPSYDKNRLAPLTTRPSTNSSQHSMASSAFETRTEPGGSVASPPSVSRISVSKGQSKLRQYALPTRTPTVEAQHPFPLVKPVVDHSCAKVNVKRPKVGTKNWFDNLDSDSSDGEETLPEPELQSDFAVKVETAFEERRIGRIAPRSSSRTPAAATSKPNGIVGQQSKKPALPDPPKTLSVGPGSSSKRRRKKCGPLDSAKLRDQSVLWLSSSDEESEIEPQPALFPEGVRRDIRASLINASPVDSEVEFGQALAVSTKESERLLQQLRKETVDKPTIPRRVSSRLLTYLDDGSTETLTQRDNLIQSFPRTPSDPASREASVMDSMLSEDESIISTKVMTVTRQEESLIAAMRLKKTAMKRAQAAAARQGCLRALEIDSQSVNRPRAAGERRPDQLPAQAHANSSVRPSFLASAKPTKHHQHRPDSVTTFQTDSVPTRSIRSSIASYLHEGSDDLQLPYSSIYGLPMGSTSSVRASSLRERSARETFLSERTVTPTMENAAPSDWSPSARGSHVVVLDPLERQLLREEIPSQLFMEPPFIGWEARANMQLAQG